MDRYNRIDPQIDSQQHHLQNHYEHRQADELTRQYIPMS